MNYQFGSSNEIGVCKVQYKIKSKSIILNTSYNLDWESRLLQGIYQQINQKCTVTQKGVKQNLNQNQKPKLRYNLQIKFNSEY